MADPRATVSHEGVGALNDTYKIDNSTITYSDTVADGSSAVGKAVTLSADDTIALAGDGEFVLGKLILVEKDGFATVRIKGGMALPGGNGATLTLGGAIVGALDAGSNKGYIRAANSATAAELARCRGFITNNDDTANVAVIL